MDTLLMPILMIMLGVLIGVLLKAFTRIVKIPYTVALFAVGLVIGLIFKHQLFSTGDFLNSGISMITEMNPDFILYVFLPILVFDAAYGMDLHVFKKTLGNASLLAGPGLVICMLLTGAFIMLLGKLSGYYSPDNWKYALMFGGLISATDPVAVVALLKELGTSKRFSTLVDGESLLNDGTGIVCFMLFYSQFTGAGAVENPLMFFLWVCLASFVLGYFISQIALGFIIKFQPEVTVQNCIMIVAAYLTFIMAQSTFAVSGVIALVVFGHFFAQRGKPILKPEADQFISKFWGFMSDIANTLIFLIVGIIIAVKIDITWYKLFEISLLFIGLNVIRFIMIWLLFPLLKRSGYGLSFKESIMLGWGGLRGALGMSMALMVSYNQNIPVDIREAILLWTAGVVTLTLCINATTSKWLVGKLGLSKKDNMLYEEFRSRQNKWIRQKDYEALEVLKKDSDLTGTDWTAVEERILKKYQPSIEFKPEQLSDEELGILLRATMLECEKWESEEMRKLGIITPASFRKLTDFISECSDFDGNVRLDERNFDPLFRRRRYFRSEKNHIIKMLEVASLFLIIQYKNRKYLKGMTSTDNLNFTVRESVTQKIATEIDNTIRLIKSAIRNTKEQYPEYYNEMITERSARLLLAKERITVEDMFHTGMIDDESSSALIKDINSRQNTGIIE